MEPGAADAGGPRTREQRELFERAEPAGGLVLIRPGVAQPEDRPPERRAEPVQMAETMWENATILAAQAAEAEHLIREPGTVATAAQAELLGAEGAEEAERLLREEPAAQAQAARVSWWNSSD